MITQALMHSTAMILAHSDIHDSSSAVLILRRCTCLRYVKPSLDVGLAHNSQY